ncbi:DUF7342 family protein [Natronocalculus amylovorans]|uniref:Sugar-specific transcriptional regulator TrmB n=1 Tax=Natronocalculus amylovorans TaxID=2917812 RepID=A0AAE3FZJ9_9EURY|nr:hypothetical protein [Natronocalculus amylovorans]MCL9817790.1 hypothetical protein [Natronocalculus amylovorans]NUE03656.1 hypothetical protein [Halorubraceae archaeon YAN]
MEEPGSELLADAEERSKSPDFDALVSPEELVRGERTRDDFFDAVLGLTSPATASEVADLAGHGVDAAREYLEWFERMGIVRQITESPATYERNQSYLNWRRIQTLQDKYSPAELVEFLKAETVRAEDLAEKFDVASPDAVSISQHAVATTQPIEAVWEDVSAWKTARRRVVLLERALATESIDAADQRTTV